MKPEIKISVYVFFVVFLFAVQSLTAYLAAFCILGVLSLKVPFRRLKAGWFPIGMFLIFTFLSNVVNRHGRILWETGSVVITDEGIQIASVKTLRILLMIMGVKIMMASSRPEEVIKALGRLLGPLEKTGVPVKDFFHTMGLTIQCFPALKNMAAETYRENVKTANPRGFWDKTRMISSFLLPMFVKSIRTPDIFFEKPEPNEK